jgi:PAS domain S-box-containing protein
MEPTLVETGRILRAGPTLRIGPDLRVWAEGEAVPALFGGHTCVGLSVLTLLPDLQDSDFGHGRRRDEEAAWMPIETTAARSDGSTFLAEVSIEQDRRSAAGGGLLCHLSDLSQLSATELLSRRERSRAQLILSAVSDAIFSVNASGRIEFANPAACVMLKRRRSDLIGEPLEGVIEHAYADGSAFTADSSPLALTLSDGISRRAQDTTVLRRDSNRLSVDLSCSAIFEGGEVSGGVVTITDVTERLALEKRKDEFLSVVSHELRTPLTSIRGSLGMLAGGVFGKLPTDAAQMVDIAMSNTQRLSRLVSDILDLERLAAGRMPMQLQTLDVSQLVRDIARQQGPAASQAGVALRLDVSSATTIADAHHLTTAIVNLVSNAIKFSSAGGSIELVTRCDADITSISVRDWGRGIPLDKRSEIFERFSQVDVADSTIKGGTGLGLAIAAHIVHALEGRVELDSDVGVGSTFTILLPRAEAETVSVS